MFALCGTARKNALRGWQTLRVAIWFALCKHDGMDTPTTFAAAAGISVPYASQILKGKRKPSQRMAISIFRKTGKKFGPIANATDEQIETLVQIEAAAA